jgi:antirestriction protein
MTARVYVGTYAKYNSGSIEGKWLYLEDYADRDAFLAACAELHKDESDPELMFQDFEGFPKSYYSESNVPAELWDWLELDENDRELLDVYQEHVDQSGTIEQAQENFAGTFSNESDWAASILDDTGALQEIPENLRYYFDYDAYARDARMNGDVVFAHHDGDVWVFWNH